MSAPYTPAQCDDCEQYVDNFCDTAGLCEECCTDCQERGREHE